MEEPASNPEREKLLKPMRDAGYEYRGLTKNLENELWINEKEKKLFLYSMADMEIIGPCQVKD
jgi:ribosome biogenesis protein Nip4